MTVAELHNNGDCWPEKCPLCQEEDEHTFECAICGERKDVEERHVDTTDYGPGDWCDDCASKPY